MSKQLMTAEAVKETKQYLKWGLSEQEYKQIEQLLGRLPNYTETAVYSAMWSEHCSYKNSKPILKHFYTQGAQVLQGPGEGAGIVDIGDQEAVVFKIESHNSPSAVEPYEGAATGVGGILRDIFSMGARPIANLAALRFGHLDHARSRDIVKGAIAGLADYSNIIGVPALGGEIQFDASYEANPLVNAFSLGILKHQDQQQGRAQGLGNVIMYVGSSTGRDGIHGASFSSQGFSEDHQDQGSAIQAGDPFLEQRLMEACLTLIQEQSAYLVGIQDMGAAGLVSSSAEMAAKANAGLVLDLDQIPQREAGMTADEILLSESQERMLLCVRPAGVQVVKDLFTAYDLHAAVVGEVVEGKSYQVYRSGQLMCDLPVHSLDDEAPVYDNDMQAPAHLGTDRNFQPVITDLGASLESLILSDDLASRQPLFQQFDWQAGGQSLRAGRTGAAIVAVPNSRKAIAMTTQGSGRLVHLEPYLGGQMAVAQAARQLVACGAKPLACTDGLNYGSPENPETYYELYHSAQGISKACQAFQSPIISGNVSLYNENNGQAIYPTPIIGMVGLIQDLDQILPAEFQEEADRLYLLGQTQADFAGSVIQKIQAEEIYGSLSFDLETEEKIQNFVYQANQLGFLQSARSLDQGGLAAALLISAFESEWAFEVDWEEADELLFSESQSRLLLSVSPDQVAAFEAWSLDQPVELTALGQVTAGNELSIKTAQSQVSLDKALLNQAWQQALVKRLEGED